MYNKKYIIIVVMIAICACFGCGSKNIIYDNKVVALNNETAMFINKNGEINITAEIKELMCFEGRDDIKSIEAHNSFVYLLTKQGEVINASFDNKDLSPITNEWENIEMIQVSGLGVFGLKKDGNVLFAPTRIMGLDSSIIEETLKNWDKMKCIAASSGVLVGVTEDGDIKAVGFLAEEFQNSTNEWHNIERVSVWDDTIIGIDAKGSICLTSIGAMSKFDNKAENILKGAEEICMGDWIIIGRMPDKTLEIVYGTIYEDKEVKIEFGDKTIEFGKASKDKEVFAEIEELENVVDISNIGDKFSILLENGEIIIAGEYEKE